MLTIFVALILAPSALAQDKGCQDQINKFLDCKHHVYDWKENIEKRAESDQRYDRCLDKNHCLPSITALPHDDPMWKRWQCEQDVDKSIRQKVMVCMRLRVSPSFQSSPPDYKTAYGRYFYETIPSNGSYLEAMCKEGNYEKASKCYLDTAKAALKNVTERKAMYEQACQRQSQCFQMLEPKCLEKYRALRTGWCECSQDVHEMYGGKRMVSTTPSCLGVSGTQKDWYKRKSCKPNDLDEQDMDYIVCKYGYEYMMKLAQERAKEFNTATSKPSG